MTLAFHGTASEWGIVAAVAMILLGSLWLVLDKTFKRLITLHHHTQEKIDRLMEMRVDDAIRVKVSCNRWGSTAQRVSNDEEEDLERTPGDVPFRELVTRCLGPTPCPSASSPLGEEADSSSPLDWCPSQGHDGQVMLLYGCEPPDVLIELLERCRPRHLVAVDSSPHALEAARIRLARESLEAELVLLPPQGLPLPLGDQEVDYIHCTGKAALRPALGALLGEFARVLSTRGRARLHVLSRDSVWWHSCTKAPHGQASASPPMEAGPAQAAESLQAHDAQEVASLAQAAGLSFRLLGTRMSPAELTLLEHHAEILASDTLADEHRRFLGSLEIDPQGRPLHEGRLAGCDAYFEFFRPAPAQEKP